MLTRANFFTVKPKVFSASVSHLIHVEPKYYKSSFNVSKWKKICRMRLMHYLLMTLGYWYSGVIPITYKCVFHVKFL